MGITGKLCEVQERKFEWKIGNFLELSNEADAHYESPEFSFCSNLWQIWIYPHGDTEDDSVGFIGLYLMPKLLTAPITVNYSLNFRFVDGREDTYIGLTETNTFDEVKSGWGRSQFISRSELIERKFELLPSEILTVICTLKKDGINDTAGDESPDKVTQTEEGTGIWKLQEQLREILENENVSDVVLKVEDQEFKSHRCILAARSPVFLAMLTHETKEKNTGVVDIQDIDPNTFSIFLRYLYTGSEKIITPESVVNLFNAADKYQVDELKKSCRDYMLKNISVDNFCDILSLSLEHSEKDLTGTCTRFFIENSLDIVKTPKWLIFVTKNPVEGNELHIKQLESNVKMSVKHVKYGSEK